MSKRTEGQRAKLEPRREEELLRELALTRCSLEETIRQLQQALSRVLELELRNKGIQNNQQEG